jgi:hypothetical protein
VNKRGERCETLGQAVEAWGIMGRGNPGSPCVDDKGIVRYVAGPEDDVRAQFQIPDDINWCETLIHLQAQGLASPCFYAAPIHINAYGYEEELTEWRDEPLCEWVGLEITAGVLALAARYPR